MKLLADVFPILLFFVTYKFYGIYIATGVAIVASFIQVGGYWFKNRRFELMQIITFLLIFILGGATLLLHNELFIKWKPTAINWIFSVVFLASRFFGDKPLIKRLMAQNINLPDYVWNRSNIMCALFFFLMGAANIYVAYNYDTDTWVNFKLSLVGLTFIFTLSLAAYWYQHMRLEE